MSGIIIITDGQIHDFHNYNKLLSKTPIHYILVGNKNEKDRILKTSNVPKYAVLGKKYDLHEIIKGDSIFCATGITNGDLVKGVYVDDNKFITETLLTHKYSNMCKIVIREDTIKTW